jgi:glycosyltransferase involved in cell wall biosynthesis
MGHKLELVCIGDSPHMRIERRDGIKLILLPSFSTFGQRSSLRRQSAIEPIRYFSVLLWSMIAVVLFDLGDLDVVHCFNPSTLMSFAILLLSRFKKLMSGRPMFVADWVDLVGGSGAGRMYPRPIRDVMALSERIVISQCDAVTVGSNFLARRAIGLGVSPKRVFGIPPGADTQLMKPIPKLDARKELQYPFDQEIIVYESGLSTVEEMVIQLLQSVRILSHFRQKLNLVVVGYSPTKRVKNFVVAMGIGDRVTFLKRQPRQMLPLFLAISDVLVLPILDDPVYWAGWQGRFGDLICAQRPLVVHDVGDVARVVRRDGLGLIARPDDPSDFAEKIGSLLSDKKLSNQCGVNCLATAKRYSWQNITDSVFAIYEGKSVPKWVNGVLDF